MVGAGAIITHTAAELGEDDHQHVIRCVVLSEVVEEALYGIRDLGPQLGMHRQLSGVGVEAAVLGVEDLGAHVGQVGHGDASEGAGDGRGGVLHAGGVLPRGLLEHVGALEGVEARAAQVVHHRSPANGGGVHAGEAFQGLCSLVLGYARKYAVGL